MKRIKKCSNRRIKKCANFGGIFTSSIAPVINGIGGVLDDTLSEQDVNQVKIEDPNTETDNTVVMRCGGKARPKCWLGAAIGATTSLASGLIGGAANRKAARKAAALRNRQTMIQDMQGRDKQLNALYSTYLNNNDNEEDLIYRRGGTATQHPRRRMFAKGGMTYKPTKQPDALDRLGNWVNKNRKSNIIAKGLYSLGFDRGTIKRTKSDIKELINRGILPDFTSDNGMLSAAGPLSGPVRSASAIAKGVQSASKIRQAANASKAEGSNIMKYVQQRANPNSIYNGRVNTIRMRTPFGQLRNRLANRNQLNALEEKAIAERYRKDPTKFIQDLVAGNIKTEAAIRRSQAAARSAREASKAAAKARKPIFSQTNNIRQNLNFEPIDDTVNGYSQVEDIQGRSYDEYKAAVDAEAEARRQEVISDLINNYNYEDRNTTDEMRYGGKARSKRRVPIKITDGGVAQRIGNNTFLLRGSSHEQVNPSGQTGIGIKVGNNEIEAEGGEVAQRVGNALRIFSAQPMINGVSPAQAVEAGANKNRIFAIQEALKRKGYKCGGRVKLKPGGKVNPIFKYNNYIGIEDLPNSNTGISSGTYDNGNLSLGQAEKTIFPKGFVSHNSNNIGSSKTNTTPIDNWWNRNGMSVNSSDWIGLGTDLAGSLALGAFNRSAYNNLKYDYKLPNYVDEIPVAFDTTYHNGAQRATVERNRLNAQKIIANNTSSANNAVQRMQQSNAEAMMETNKLWDEKANKEAELRNMAAQNEQQVRARNAAARNQYYQNVAEIQNRRIDAENANRLARSNAWATSLQGLQGAANNFLNSTRQRYEDENALMATIAAGDAATPYRMMAFGTQFGPRIINAIRAMNNVEGMKNPGAAPIRSNYSNDADYSTARSKWEAAMKNYEYWKQRNQFLSNYDSRGRLIRRR